MKLEYHDEAIRRKHQLPGLGLHTKHFVCTIPEPCPHGRFQPIPKVWKVIILGSRCHLGEETKQKKYKKVPNKWA
jgi:hypothetical protein